jgi:guanosine-3',5'-bis(diphosphate) 3'-pyrophosphohydrolase
VLEMTDDMSLTSAERKREQVTRAPGLSQLAKSIKIADKIANVGDIARHPPADWSEERRRKYFLWTEEVIAGCRGVNDALERHYDNVLRAAMQSLGGHA